MHFADWALAISCYKCPKMVDIKSFRARSTRCIASGDMGKLQQLPCTDKENFQPTGTAAGLSVYLNRVSGCVVVTDDAQYRVSYLVQRH